MNIELKLSNNFIYKSFSKYLTSKIVTSDRKQWCFAMIKEKKGVEDKSQKKMITDFCNMTGT